MSNKKQDQTQSVDEQVMNLQKTLCWNKIYRRVMSASMKSGAVYMITVSIAFESPSFIETSIEHRTPVQFLGIKQYADGEPIAHKMKRFARLPVNKLEYTTECKVTAEKLVDEIVNSIDDNNQNFKNRITENAVISIIKLCDNVEAYYKMREMETKTDQFDMHAFLEMAPDGLYRAFDSSNRKKETKNPPFLILKRAGQYTVIDIDGHNNFTFTDNVSADAILSRASINFGGWYSIRSANIS